MAAYEDKILILIEAVDKTNTVLSDIQKKLQGVKSDTLGWGKMLGGITLGTQISAGISAVKDAILDATRATLKWSGDMETFGLSIASSLLVGGKYIDQMSGKALGAAESFSMARQQAAGILQELQAANLETIATLDQLTRVYVETLPIALNKGFNTRQVKDFTLAVVQAAGAIGLEMDMIAEETRAMLTPSINPRFSRVAVSLGLTNEDIRQHSQNADTLFKFLMGKLEAFRLAGEMTQRTWKGLWSNLTDVGLQAGAMALEPVFVSIKSTIEETLSMMVRVNEETKKIEWNPAFLQVITNVKTTLEGIVWLMEKITTIGGAISPGLEAEQRRRSGEGTFMDKVGQYSPQLLKLLGAIPGVGPIFSGLSAGAGALKGITGYEKLSDEDLEKAINFSERTRGIAARNQYEKLKTTNQSDKYASMLNIAGTAFNIDPNFIKAVMMAESTGNPLAVSPKGAVGLMQIMPSNFKGFMDQLVKTGKIKQEDLDKFSSIDQAALDPFINIMMGAQYLNEAFNVVGRGEDKIGDVAAYYNMGGPRYKLRVGKGLPFPDESIEHGEKVRDFYSKFKGTDIFAEQSIVYEGNQRMSKADIELSEKAYQNKIKNVQNFTKALGIELDSQSKLELSKLDAQHSEGLINEDEYYSRRTEIVKTKTDAEIKMLLDQNDAVMGAFREARMSNLSEEGVYQGIFGDEGDMAREAEKVTGLIEANNAKIKALKDEQAVAENQETVRREKNAYRNMVIEDQQATSYKEMADKVAGEIDALKVKYNEMLPGDALIAEHERQVEALVEHFNRLRDIRDSLAAGSTEWTTANEKMVNITLQLYSLRQKEPYVKKESGIESAAKRIENARAIEQEAAAYYELTGKIDEYQKYALAATISELKFKQVRADGHPQVQAYLQKEIEYNQELLDIFNDYGPAFAGFVQGLRDIKKESDSMYNSVRQLITGIFSDMKGATTNVFYGLLKGNISWDKEDKEKAIKLQIQGLDLQVEELKKQKEQIDKNDQLTASEKNAQKEAIDARIKQIEAQKDLGLAQQDAIQNSTSWKEIFDTFLNQLTQRIAAFLADATIKAFIAFITGDWGSFTGAGGFLGLLGGGGSGGGGGGGGGIMGLLGMGEKGYKAYGWYQKLADWWSGGSEAGALAANPSLGGDLAGIGGADYGSLAGLSGEELAGTYGMEMGSSAALSEGVGGGMMAGEFGELGGATYSGLAAEGAIGAGTGAGAGAGSGATAAIAAAGPWMTAAMGAFVTYKIISTLQEMAVDDEKVAKGHIASALQSIGMTTGMLKTPEGTRLTYAGEENKFYSKYGVSPEISANPDEMRSFDVNKATDTEKIEAIKGYMDSMKDWQKDAKLTDEEIQKLTVEAIGPQNAYLADSIKLLTELDKIGGDYNDTVKGEMNVIGESNEQMELRVASQEKAKELLAGMNQSMIEAIPNLQNYGDALSSIGVTYDTYNSLVIDSALFTNDLRNAQALLTDGLTNDEPAQYAKLLEQMRGALEQNGRSILDNIPNIEAFIEVLRELGITLDDLPKDTTINVNGTSNITYPGEGAPTAHSGGFVGRYHRGGFLKYHPWGGGIGGDEVPIIAQKGEYVLSKKDVEFIEKVKGQSGVVALPPILPRVNVLVNNQSSASVQSAGATRLEDGKFIVDVILKDLHSNGRLRRALSFV